MSDFIVRGGSRPQEPVAFSTAQEALLYVQRTGRIPYNFIKEQGLAYVPYLADALNLDTKLMGKELQMLNPHRRDTEFGSFSINTETGVFADFATDDVSGGDVIAWVAYIKTCKQSVAAKWILDLLVLLEAQRLHSVTIDMPQSHALVATSASQSKARDEASRRDTIPPEAFQKIIPKGMSLEAQYEYRSASGTLMFVVLRLRDKLSKKTFRPACPITLPDGSLNWLPKLPSDQRPLYNLPKLVAMPDALVFVVEGEKTAEALQRIFPEAVVVTTAGGAQSPGKTDLSPLVGRQVLIWPDNDLPGQKYADTIVRELRKFNPNTPLAVVDPAKLFEQLRAHDPHFPPVAGLVGWDAADIETVGIDAETLKDALGHSIGKPEQTTMSKAGAANEKDEAGEGPGNVTWPPGLSFRLTEDHVQMLTKEEVWWPICSRIEILRQLRDAEGLGWSLELRILTSDGSTQTFIFPRAMLADAAATKTALMDRGVVVHNPQAVMNYLGQAKHNTTHDLAHHVGWTGSSYVLADRVYGHEAKRIALHPNAPAFPGYAVSGSLADWNASLGRLCVGNSRLMVSVLTALAGPLARLAGIDSGGFHFYGVSSSGKTTLLIAGASVLGPWKETLRTWRTTSNALEVVAAGLNDSTLFLDEIGQVKAEEVGETVYMLANGQGKGRMTRTGQQARLLEWTLLFLSTGEISLQQTIESGSHKVRAGMELRMVSLPADAGAGLGVFEDLHDFPSSKALADHLRKAAGENYGIAADAWFNALTDMAHQFGVEAFRTTCRSRLAELEVELLPSNADGQVARVVRRFALLALAGELAVQAGVGGWSVKDVKAAMQRCLADWILHRGGTGPSEEAQALHQAQAFFETHGASAFQRLGIEGIEPVSLETRPVQHRAGYYDPNGDGGNGLFYVFPSAFKDRVCSGLNQKLVTKVLREKGVLLRDASSTIRISGVPSSARYYQISARIIGFADDDDGETTAVTALTLV